jgi:hypothetical protein
LALWHRYIELKDVLNQHMLAKLTQLVEVGPKLIGAGKWKVIRLRHHSGFPDTWTEPSL